MIKNEKNIVVSSGIKQNDKLSGLTIFPNSANNEVSIMGQRNLLGGDIKIQNITAKQLLKCFISVQKNRKWI